MSNLKTNYGLAILNDAPVGSTATIAATGLGRSGTTMLARVLIELDVPMGQKIGPQSAEDKELLRLLKTRDLEGFATACQARDEKYQIWGFKCPALRGQIAPALKWMRAPRLILSFRDIMAVAQRNALSVDAELLEAIETSARGYVKMVQALRDLQVPILLISYEKALQYPMATVQAMAEFCGRPVSEEHAEKIAAGAIRNADPRYVNPARAQAN